MEPEKIDELVLQVEKYISQHQYCEINEFLGIEKKIGDDKIWKTVHSKLLASGKYIADKSGVNHDFKIIKNPNYKKPETELQKWIPDLRKATVTVAASLLISGLGYIILPQKEDPQYRQLNRRIDSLIRSISEKDSSLPKDTAQKKPPNR